MWFTGSAFRPLSLVSLSYPWLLERRWKHTYSTTMLLSSDCICWCVWHLNVEDFIDIFFFNSQVLDLLCLMQDWLLFLLSVLHFVLHFVSDCISEQTSLTLRSPPKQRETEPWDPLADGIFWCFSLGEKRSWSLDCSPIWDVQSSGGTAALDVMGGFEKDWLWAGGVFVQGSGAKRQSCWLIDMQAELLSLRCWLPHKSASHTQEPPRTHT